MRLTPSSPIPERKKTMICSMNNMDLMAMIVLNRVILNKIFSEVQTSIKSLKKWQRPSGSEILMRSLENRMARDTAPLSLEDQVFLEEYLYFPIRATRGMITLRSQLLMKSSLDTW